MTEGQEANVRGKAYAGGPRSHGPGHGRPRWQVAVLDEVVLGEPDEIQAQPVEPAHLLENLRVQPRHGDTGIGRIAEIVDDADAKGRAAHRRLRYTSAVRALRYVR